MEKEMDRVDVSGISFLSAPPPQVAERIQRQPECRLLWVVLQDGVETYMKYAAATGRLGKRLFVEVERWIMEDDPIWLCSFVNRGYPCPAAHDAEGRAATDSGEIERRRDHGQNL